MSIDTAIGFIVSDNNKIIFKTFLIKLLLSEVLPTFDVFFGTYTLNIASISFDFDVFGILIKWVLILFLWSII